MSTYRTVFAAEARDELRKISSEIALRILAKLTELGSDPCGLGTTALVSQPARRRLRVSDYRIISTVEADQLIVWVVHVGQRSTVNGQRSTIPERVHRVPALRPKATPRCAKKPSNRWRRGRIGTVDIIEFRGKVEGTTVDS